VAYGLWVRLVSRLDDRVRTGLVMGDEIVDLADPAAGLPGDTVDLLDLGPDAADTLRQDGNTGDMIFIGAQMVEHLSTAFTLEPGMILSTGTPAGVGAKDDPPRWLSAGDTVRIAIGGIGELSNPVVNEPGPDGHGAD
jgi:2-keto-4-pentenoate hydratase/2-oxohepta-3-ene-1,7-dioic acid hydratase in catechol pathway